MSGRHREGVCRARPQDGWPEWTWLAGSVEAVHADPESAAWSARAPIREGRRTRSRGEGERHRRRGQRLRAGHERTVQRYPGAGCQHRRASKTPLAQRLTRMARRRDTEARSGVEKVDRFRYQGKLQLIAVDPIEQQPIRLDMKVPEPLPVALERMVTASWRQRLLFDQQRQHRLKLTQVPAASFCIPDIASELSGPDGRQHIRYRGP